MQPTCIRYDAQEQKIVIYEYQTGRGGKWEGTPIYMIQCACGYPLKTMFRGQRPGLIQKCEFNAYHHDESCKVHELKDGAAWGIQLEENNCPACGAAVAIGPNILIAVERFIRAHVTERHYHYNSNKIKVSPKAKKALEKMVKFKAIRFCRESVTNRPDFAVSWRTGNEKHDFDKGDWNKWYDARQAEIEALKQAFGLDHEEEKEVDPFDFSDDVINAHGEDCTCNLCQK